MYVPVFVPPQDDVGKAAGPNSSLTMICDLVKTEWNVQQSMSVILRVNMSVNMSVDVGISVDCISGLNVR